MLELVRFRVGQVDVREMSITGFKRLNISPTIHPEIKLFIPENLLSLLLVYPAFNIRIMRLHTSIYFCLIITLLPYLSFSQKGTIKGIINDDITRTPIQGATINLPSNGKVDNSDHFGSFSINDIVPGQYELVVSHIGYKTAVIPVEVKINSVSKVAVNLLRSNVDLSEITLSSKKYSPLNTIAAIDIKLRPVNTSQDILRVVPGLFIAQHAGGGKAEQIFLRGFDIDHGTDINITVDGLPVNMVSHAHGQGYADLHFLIPETVDKAEFEKGPYYASKGNLATAGYVALNTKEFLQDNMVKIEAGQFNMQRAVGLVKLFNKQTDRVRQQFYVGSEYYKTDGYFDAPQDFHRFNIMGKYNLLINNETQLTLTASTLDSRWDASGQVPQRAVESGLISRWGSIDNSEGGYTSRTNFNAFFRKKINSSWEISNRAHYSRYYFNLYSNFTFFLNDPVNGDEINQKESRNIFGYTGTATHQWQLGNKLAETEFGAGFRYDDVKDLELNYAVKRVFLDHIQKGAVKETNAFAYVDQDVDLSDKWKLNAGLRFDAFRFGYKDVLQGETEYSYQSRSIVSPKLNFTYAANSKLKLFLNNGIGFHSNDTRVILDNAAKDILPRVYGTDLGVIVKPTRSLIVKTTLWHLFSEQEFVYVGDAGIVEPGGRTRRIGIDVSARYQITHWLFADADINLTKARAVDEDKGNDYVPLAPAFTSTGGLTVKTKSGFNGSIHYRYIDDRPANEDYSVTAKGYFIADVVAGYRYKKFEFNLSFENIFDVKWNEAQFDTESRLQMEPAAVSEIHFTPGTPRFVKAGLSFYF